MIQLRFLARDAKTLALQVGVVLLALLALLMLLLLAVLDAAQRLGRAVLLWRLGQSGLSLREAWQDAAAFTIFRESEEADDVPLAQMGWGGQL
jgi:hypothetical protein